MYCTALLHYIIALQTNAPKCTALCFKTRVKCIIELEHSKVCKQPPIGVKTISFALNLPCTGAHLGMFQACQTILRWMNTCVKKRHIFLKLLLFNLENEQRFQKEKNFDLSQDLCNPCQTAGCLEPELTSRNKRLLFILLNLISYIPNSWNCLVHLSVC